MVNNVNFITWIVIKSRTNFALTARGGGGDLIARPGSHVIMFRV